ncbi:MAG: hypothetical protein V3R31_02960 [Candidatus Humimicrobiaceae bacterium]
MIYNNIYYGAYAIFLVHLLISLIYFAFILRKNTLQQSIFRFLIVFLLPVLGLLFFVISGIFNRVFKEKQNVEESYQKYIKDQEQVDYIEDIDFKREMNTIPISDSLTMGSQQERRAFLVELLKKDYTRYIKVLQKAVENEDSETSHYAGAALMEIRKQFEIMLRNSNKAYEENKKDTFAIKEYIDAIKKYLNSGLPDNIDKQEFRITLSYLLEKYLEKDHTAKQYYIDKINTDLELENIKEVEDYTKRFCNHFPSEEEPYFMLLKYFYSINNYKSILKVVKLIKKRFSSLNENNKKIFKYWERFISDAF